MALTHVTPGRQKHAQQKVLAARLSNPLLCPHVAPSRRKQVYCVCCALYSTFLRSREHSNASTAPFLIVDNMNCISPTLRIGYQEDAHEFLAHLLDRTEIHCKRQTPPLPLCEVMRGQLLGTVRCCVCGEVSKKQDPFETLSLEVSGVSVHEMLRHFTASEVLDGDNKYRCEGRCGKALVRAPCRVRACVCDRVCCIPRSSLPGNWLPT